MLFAKEVNEAAKLKDAINFSNKIIRNIWRVKIFCLTLHAKKRTAIKIPFLLIAVPAKIRQDPYSQEYTRPQCFFVYPDHSSGIAREGFISQHSLIVSNTV